MSISLNIPSIDASSLGGSLFECITIDAERLNSKNTSSATSPSIVQAGIICICLRGEASFTINDQEFTFHKGDMLTLLPNTIIRNGRSSDDFLGYAIGANTKFMMGIQMTDVVKSYVNITNHPVLPLNGAQIQTIIELCEMLKTKRAQTSHPFNREISKNLLAVLCYEIHSFYQIHAPIDAAPHSRQSALFQEFLSLVENNAGKHRDISFYADQLCITPKYLSQVVMQVSGKTALSLIEEYVITECRALLSSTDMTIQQIADAMNFPSQSVFGKYFKRVVGVSPKGYRE